LRRRSERLTNHDAHTSATKEAGMDEQKERALRKEAARLVTGKRTVTLRDWIDTGIAVDWADDQTATSVNVHGRLSRDAERIRELETILARCATALTRVSCQIDDLEDEDRMDAVDAADDARALLTRAEHAETSHCEHCDDDPAKCDPDETGGCACCCHESNRPDDTISRLRADLARVTGEWDGMLCNGTALRGEILGACCPEKNGDDLDPLVEVRRVVADLARVEGLTTVALTRKIWL